MAARTRLAIFPGSFDPLTLGHLDIIERAAALFDALEVAVGVHSAKNYLLNPDERCLIIESSVEHLDNVTVRTFDGLVAAHARSRGADALVRGLRQSGDFEYEVRMAHANGQLAEGLETVFLPASAAYAFLSGTIVRDVFRHGGDVASFVPKPVARFLEKKRSSDSH